MYGDKANFKLESSTDLVSGVPKTCLTALSFFFEFLPVFWTLS